MKKQKIFLKNIAKFLKKIKVLLVYKKIDHRYMPMVYLCYIKFSKESCLIYTLFLYHLDIRYKGLGFHQQNQIGF